eukprot:scaffold180432_cov15-Tisochrysis_lutea.AAC.2
MMMRLFKEEIYKQYPLLSSFYERFAAAQGIKEYLESPRRPVQQNAITCGRLCHPKTPANASFLPYGCDLKKEQTALPGCVGGN